MKTQKKSEPPVVLASCKDGVATVVFNRGVERNLIDNEFIETFRKTLKNVADDLRLRCLILKGNGPVFSGGGRIQWLQSAAKISAKKNASETHALVALFAELNNFRAPVIAAVHGAAIGGAVALVCACDIVIATEDTVFSLSEVRLGLVPACAAPFVIAKIGASWSRRLFVTGEKFSAKQALEIAMIHQIVSTPEELDNAVAQVVSNILDCAPEATRMAKRLVLNLSSPESRRAIKNVNSFAANTLAQLRSLPEAREGMAAFLAKRQPKWKTKS